MRGFFLLLLIGYSLTSFAQSNSYVVIDGITVEGNARTKEKVILRELGFQNGDTINLDELPSVLTTGEQMLMNTWLFSKAEITYQDWKAINNHIKLKVLVEETWYIYPIPSFKLADRNFNVWWTEHNRSLSRTNIGMDFTHLNSTGRGDRLKLAFQLGYTPSYRLRYNTRALNRSQTLGLTADFSYSRNREVNYATIDNRQVFFDNETDFSYSRLRSDLSFTYRPGLLKTHAMRVGFRRNRISEEISGNLNPDFFLDAKDIQRFFLIEYSYTYDKRDVRNYPMAGNYFTASIEKDGLGIFNDRSALTSILEYHFYSPFLKAFNLEVVSKMKYSIFRGQQPYNDNRAIGFSGNSLRGYEFYVIDGQDMALLNTSLRLPIFKKEFQLGRLMPLKAFRRIPVRCNLSINNDFGYVNNPQEKAVNPFNNRLLWGTGLGLDTIFYYDFVLRIEYSFNHLGESGLFLHFNSSI